MDSQPLPVPTLWLAGLVLHVKELRALPMPWARSLPFVLYTDEEGQFLHGTSGRDLYRDRAQHVFPMYGAAAAKNPFGFAHLLAAQDFAQRGPLEIVLAGDRLGAIALVESVHRTYLPARVVAFAEDVPTGEGRYPVDGQPTAYVCRNRTCDARVTSAHALVDQCVA